jgi:hypothetical protein
MNFIRLRGIWGKQLDGIEAHIERQNALQLKIGKLNYLTDIKKLLLGSI